MMVLEIREVGGEFFFGGTIKKGCGKKKKL